MNRLKNKKYIIVLLTIVAFSYIGNEHSSQRGVKYKSNMYLTLNDRLGFNENINNLQSEIVNLKKHNNKYRKFNKIINEEIVSMEHFKNRNSTNNEIKEVNNVSVSTTKSNSLENDINDQLVLQYNKINDKILNEDVDVNWSVSAKGQITSMFSSENLTGLELVDLDCRSTLCKIDISIVDEGGTYRDDFVSAETAVDKLTRVAPWPGEAAMEINSEGTNAVIYIFRRGHMLFSE